MRCSVIGSNNQKSDFLSNYYFQETDRRCPLPSLDSQPWFALMLTDLGHLLAEQSTAKFAKMVSESHVTPPFEVIYHSCLSLSPWRKERDVYQTRERKMRTRLLVFPPNVFAHISWPMRDAILSLDVIHFLLLLFSKYLVCAYNSRRFSLIFDHPRSNSISILIRKHSWIDRLLEAIEILGFVIRVVSLRSIIIVIIIDRSD